MHRLLVLSIGLFTIQGWAAESVNDKAGDRALAAAAAVERACTDCHTCAKPTQEAPCLAPCPRLSATRGPDVVLLDQLSNQYVPVIFAHKLHAQMTEMTGGCELCHHYNPPNKVLPCRNCHGAASSPTNLEQPGLKGAYHRQCLNCHREWSHQTDCAVCHAKKTAESVAVQVPDPTDIMGMLHPNVEEPVIKIYHTKYEKGALATFRHKEHVERFGFKCVTCHREESCSRCHSPEEKQMHVKTLADHHRPCLSCHGIVEERPQDCLHCHADEEVPRFSHERTGLVLDENHADNACFDCHLGSKFKETPSCGECHEQDITYPAKLPGTKVEKP